jgi:hypothetical protein
MSGGDGASFALALRDSAGLLQFARADKEYSWWLAEAFARFGRTEAAFEWLENSIEHGFFNPDFWYINPNFAALRVDLRFEALMRRAMALRNRVDA